MIPAGDRPDLNLRCADRDFESVGPWPRLSGTAGVEVERSETALREGVAREVRLAQQEHAGDPSFAREDMPDRLARGPQAHLLNDLGEEPHQRDRRSQRRRIASVRVYDPFGSKLDSLHDRRKLITLSPPTSNSFQTGRWPRAGSETFPTAVRSTFTELNRETKEETS